jgi:hypothetical protein
MPCIRTLDCGGVHVIDHAGKADALHAFYYDLLGRARPTAWAFDLGRLYSGAPQVDVAALIGPFDRKEIKVAIWSMGRSSAPRAGRPRTQLLQGCLGACRP